MVKLLVKSTWLSRGASRWFGDFLPNSRGYLFRLALENHEIISLNNRNMDGHHLQLLFSIDMFIDRTALILAIFLLPTSALRSRSLQKFARCSIKTSATPSAHCPHIPTRRKPANYPNLAPTFTLCQSKHQHNHRKSLCLHGFS